MVVSVVASVLGIPLKVANRGVRTVARIPPLSWSVILGRCILVRGIDGLSMIIARITKGPSSSSVYLQGINAPQPDETVVVDARVTGTLPEDLHGLHATVGPNPQFLPLGGYHPFEGDGSVITVRIRKKDGRVSFAYTHMQTEKRAYEQRIGRSGTLSIYGMRGFAGLILVMLNAMRRSLTKGTYSQSLANTNIEEHGGKLLVLMESVLPYQLGLSKDGCALQCTKKLALGNYTGSFSAHPVAHPSNGCLYSVSYSWLTNEGGDATVVVLDSKAQFLRSFPLTLGRKPWIHDASISEKFLIILDFPVLFSPEEIPKRTGQILKHHPDKPSRIGLLPVDAIDDSGILWFEIPSAACFHALNAYDSPTGVVLYLCQMDYFDITETNQFLDTMQLVRHDIDITKNIISSSILPTKKTLREKFGADTFIDFPFVNTGVFGKVAKYAFATVFTKNEHDGGWRNSGIVKFNLQTGTVMASIEFGGTGLGDAILTMRENALHESDGYLTAFVRDASGNTALHIFDAANMQTEPLACIHGPAGFHIPAIKFHSVFLREKTLNNLKSAEV